MKKDKSKINDRDKIFWEDFVSKNNVKKKNRATSN